MHALVVVVGVCVIGLVVAGICVMSLIISAERRASRDFP